MSSYEELDVVSRSSPSTSLQNLRMSTDESIYESTVESSVVEVDSAGISVHFFPSSPIEAPLRTTALSCGILQLATGLAMGCVATAVTSLLRTRADVTLGHPLIWWSGVAPILIGVVGIYTFTTKQRKHFYRWGLGGVLVSLTECALLGGIGAFDTAAFNVWPLYGTKHGHDICRTLVQSCYCQDYYHGKWSHLELADVQYIHEDVVWVDTGFAQCHDVHLLSALFYVHFVLFGFFAVISIATFALAVRATACGPPDQEEFHRLDDSSEFEDNFVINERLISPLNVDGESAT